MNDFLDHVGLECIGSTSVFYKDCINGPC